MDTDQLVSTIPADFRSVQIFFHDNIYQSREGNVAVSMGLGAYWNWEVHQPVVEVRPWTLS